MKKTNAAGVVFAALSLTPIVGWGQPPVAPVRPVRDTYYRQTLTDPYRWMEDGDQAEFRPWLAGQDRYARTTLAAIPGRAALRAEIGRLDNAGTSVSSVQCAGGRWFYLKSQPGDPVPRLYVRTGLRGSERVLIAPARSAKGGHAAIDYYTASWDGRRVAYGVSAGGSEDSVLRVRDVATGRDTGEAISRAQYGGVAWTLDSRSFFFIRLNPPVPGDPAGRYENSRTYLHRVGSDPAGDVPTLGSGLSSRIPLRPSDVPSLQVTPASPYGFAVIQHGVRHEWTIYAAPRASLGSASAPWVKVCDEADGVTGFDAHGGTAYLLTHKNASRFQVVAVSLDRPGFAHARVILPAGRAVLTGLGAAADALYVSDSEAGLSRVRRVPFAGGPVTALTLPYRGAVDSYSLTVSPSRPGLVFLESGWTHSALWFAYDPTRHRVTDTGLKPPSPVSFAGVQAEEVFAPGLDGTPVPLSILSDKGLRRDGTHPTLMAGYGAYGYSPYYPRLNPTWKAWLDRGGVLAFAHVRGGGEYGEDWHRAGQKLRKHNTWEDFIACGEYLVRHGYTSPRHLAGEGGSAGSIMVGRALTSRPELWGAMVCQVGSLNPLRAELAPNGPPNIPEFGSFKTPEGFRGLYAMDAYQHVRDGVAYPAVLLTTGINDPRVAPWEPAKMTARLQAATSSGKPVLLRVDYDAGHGIGSTKAQRDDELADEYAFLLWQFGLAPFQPR